MNGLKTVLAILALSFLGANVIHPEEHRVPGGLSPNGKLEVVAVEKNDSAVPEFTYEFVLRDLVSKNVLSRVSQPGYPRTIRAAVDNEYAVNSCVLWNSASNGFAFSLRDNKRSRSTLVFALESDHWTRLRLPDPFPEIFKELGISEVDRCAFTDPLRWDSVDTLVLKASGDCGLPRRGQWFEYEVKFNLHGTGLLSLKQTALRDRNG